MEILLGLLGLAFFLFGPIAFFLVIGARTRLSLAEQRVKSLEARIADVEDRPVQQARTRTSAADTGLAGEDAAITEPVRTPPPDEVSTSKPVPEAETNEAETKPAQAANEAAPEPETQTAIPLPGGSLPPEPPIEPPAQGKTPEPPAHAPSLEERLGTRWAVWVGGIALAFGAILLVRQAFILGWFGPGFRILTGLALSAALIGAGEWLRRRERASGDVSQVVDSFSFERPNIPAILTAAGTIAAFGTVYAAYALYDFIGPGLAFVALGIIGMAAMFASALHGPMLAGLGLLGAMGSPVLISSNKPSPWPLVVYLAVVVAAAYGLARLRVWLWLALAAAIGAAAWCFILINAFPPQRGLLDYQGVLLYTIIQAAMALFIFAWEPWRNTRDEDAGIDPLASFVSAGVAALSGLALVSGNPAGFGSIWVISAIVMAGMLAAAGTRLLPAILASCFSGLLLLLALLAWPWDMSNPTRVKIGQGAEFTLYSPDSPAGYGMFALLMSAGLAALCAWRLLRGPALQQHFVAIYGGVSVLTPLFALILVYMRMTAGATSTLYASLACALALAFTMAAHVFRGGVKDGEPAAWKLSLGIYASGAIAALALAMVLVLDGGALTVALALAALGAAFVSVRLDIPALRWCVVGLGIAVAARFMWEPRIVADPGKTPILNWLLFGYGVPALAFGYAARIMRLARGEDTPVRIGEALAIMCSALLVFFQIRHFINGGDAYARTSNLTEAGLFAIASFAFALVLMRLDLRRHSIVMNIGSYAFGIISMAISAIGLGLAVNPLFNAPRVLVEGGTIFNNLLLAYLLPGLMALLIGRMADGLRPRWYVVMMRVAAVALIFGYISLLVRFIYQGPNIGLLRRTSDAEWYTYSVVWLAFGIALLAYGLWRRSVEVRLASAIFIVLSVVKVFIFDLAGLEGVLRALSFIGLGIVLIGIGIVYQKFVFVRKAPQTPPPPEVAAA